MQMQDHLVDTSALCREFDIHPERGFLPAEDPLTCLPAYYHLWEELAASLTPALNAGTFRELAKNLPTLSTEHLDSRVAWERAYLLLSCFGHAWHWQTTPPDTTIPASIAKPWTEVADHLDRPAVITHSALVLRNWRRLDAEQPIALGNIACLMQFSGGQDEAWFYLLTVAMEAQGGPMLRRMMSLKTAVEDRNEAEAVTILQGLRDDAEALTVTFNRMREKCDPYIFYHRVRPYLASLTKVKYEGCEPEIRNYSGGSAAQSTLIQSFDAALGVHREGGGAGYLLEMRRYMPTDHRRFLHWLEEGNDLPSWAEANLNVRMAREEALASLRGLRQAHLDVVHEYIVAQSKLIAGPGATGTGGTDPGKFLKAVKDTTV